MSVPRIGIWLVGLGCLSLAPWSAAALEGENPPIQGELHASAAEPLHTGSIGPAASLGDGEGLLPAPNPGDVAEAAPPSSLIPAEPERTGSVDDVRLPELPAAPAEIKSTDLISGALQARLADPKLAMPPRLPRRDREALATYYVAARFQAAWIAEGTWTNRAKEVIDRLKRADEDGLDPADYPVPILGSGPDARADSAADVAEAELKLSGAAALYARDARGGRIDPARLSGLITPKLELPAAEAVLAHLAAAPDPGAALESYNPAYPGYRALKAKLAELRANRPAQPLVASPKAPAYSSRRIASLEGIVPPPRLEGDLVANMERWRWLPADVSRRYIFVNIPEFRLELIEDGRAVHETRVITGKPVSPTPVFSGQMEFAVVNPSWYIPPSIMKKEILPGLAADPTYAEQRGYEVVRRGNQITVRQPPGERNALGFIKFMFPNQHAVYLHDTPNRNLFSAAQRAFSHGCVRVEQPFRLADFVLGHEWSEPRLRKLIGRGERTIRLPAKLPVHLAYFTMRVDAAGEIRIFDDLYGHNRRVRAALGLGA
jgi:murein L,D-transpeptidase YcbB/YkuD